MEHKALNLLIQDISNSITSGFSIACENGPLCLEPMFGVVFEVTIFFPLHQWSTCDIGLAIKWSPNPLDLQDASVGQNKKTKKGDEQIERGKSSKESNPKRTKKRYSEGREQKKRRQEPYQKGKKKIRVETNRIVQSPIHLLFRSLSSGLLLIFFFYFGNTFLRIPISLSSFLFQSEIFLLIDISLLSSFFSSHLGCFNQ